MNRAIAPQVKLIETVDLPPYELLHLDNSVPVYVINEGEQEVVKVELMFKAGKWYEDKNLLADLTSRMIREGTSKHNAKELAGAFDFYGANFNVGAGFETAGGSLYTLTKHADNLLPLLAEVFQDSIFPAYEFETIITNRRQKLAVDMKKNDFVANRNFVSALFGKNHPYGRVTEPEHFSAISTDDLKTFFKKYYNPANLTIMMAGKFEDSLLKQLNKLFGSTPVKSDNSPGQIEHAAEPSNELTLHTEKSDSVQTAVVLGNLSIGKTHPDFLKLTVLNTVFGGYFGSRLMSNIREEKGYTYGIYSSAVSYPHAGFIEIAAEVGKDVREDTLKQIEFEINRLRTETIGEEELMVVKNYMCGKILRSVDGPLKFSETLKGLILYDQDVTYIQHFLQTVRDVTAAELQQLAVKYFDFSKMYKVTVG
jgi:zinc protease